MPNIEKLTRLVPVTFWDDHEGRDLAEGAEVIEQKGNRYRIEFTPAALDELESDADYYANHMPEFEKESPFGRSICTSARATLRALEAQATGTITIEDGGMLECSCGNDVMGEGFYTANPDTGAEVEPDAESWNGRRWRCGRCGANYDHEVN
jgi:hypothetical protein